MKIAHFSILTLTLFVGLVARGAPQITPDGRCTEIAIATETLAWPPVFSEADYYDRKEWQSVMVLSDGRTERWGRHAVGERIARRHPNKKVTRTDLDFVGDKQTENLRTMHLDNTQPFPKSIKENSQDVIIMRRGLCRCKGGTACAGFTPSSPEAVQFFGEVMKALNKNNPSAIAYLHGSHNNTRSSGIEWYQSAMKAKRTVKGADSLKIEIVNDQLGEFAAIKISR